ncbi:hypothetical protein ENSA5_03760 [Enhygromyxa salina]|uniref:Uncharacterized protein n=1 Tax=Enhygromyxa salina TaxID=215803 RepID=A0A2S9YJH0_9BACT|nr:hypothetical protein [Enhygromyxa salina]PRQ05257.1 hypothetical protein ENSA5_03760 [Enhygromyxa salina]
MRAKICWLLLPLASACGPEPAPTRAPPPRIEAAVEPGYPALDASCRGPVAEPTHLVVTSTDFNTGAVGLVELAARRVDADLALASTDAVAVVDGGRVFVINRFGFDYVDELDADDGLALIHEWPILAASVDAPSNPHALALDPEGHAWVSLHGAPELQRFAFPTLANAKVNAELALDLSSFADADGIPELSLTLACGSLLFVSAERVDRDAWVPAEQTVLIPLRAAAEPSLFEFDAANPGPDGITLLGEGVGPWRLDPADPDGHTLLLLNSGLERVDLASGTSEWVVDQQVFADAGYGRLQLSGFDLDSAGRPWISAASENFASFRLLRVDLDGGPDPVLITEVEGLDSVSGALEIVGDEAWFADTTLGASGLRVFDLSHSPVVELPESPLAVGLPPLSLAPL